MARKIGGLAVLSVAAFAMMAATSFAQSPALVPRDSRPFTPPDMHAPPPRATAPQAQATQAQPPVTQAPTPASQGLATIAPAPLLQKPPVPPVVTMQNGLLSIDAANSNLSDVLSAVRRAIGATIEGGNQATERVVVHLGPGRPNDVISALLTGSRYDYVLLGSAQQPGAVTRIMLTVRQGGDQVPQPQAASNVPPAANNPDDDGAIEDTPEQREQDVRQAEPPPAAPPQGSPQPGQPQNAQQPGTSDNQPKTPQQLYEEIQRMQQQRQQQMQQDQQNQQQPAAPPPD